MKVDGSCHCGKITFEAEIDPDTVTICHCTDCQKLTGTAFRVSVPAISGTLQFLASTPKTYVKMADSGNERVQGFCADCGSPIYSTSPGPNPSRYGLRVGCLAQRDQLVPNQQVWLRSALSWLPDMQCGTSFDRESH
ncbi:GFA family protein [Phyllobacterium sp. 628]|uniref:GFA family protein n=1 Tax=Phyllobacterium sp. 628 TaxID=2718938 RepID=UPI00166239A9|nr:GFA family protein [Phyllobacterium sp. 628]QND52330.1 GFA family protein [Phyllobacterium sp. 628]